MFGMDVKAREMSDIIKNCDEYKAYRDNLERVKQDEFLMVRINDYRRKYFAIHANGNTNIKQQIDALFSEFRDVFENEMAKEFIDSEMTLCRMLQKLNSSVIRDIEIELDFL